MRFAHPTLELRALPPLGCRSGLVESRDPSKDRQGGGLRLSFDAYCLDLRSERLWHGTRAIALTPKAFAVLRRLALSSGALVTKDELLDALGKGPDAAAIAELLRRHAPTWLAQLPWLVSDADRALLEKEILGATRDRMLREMASAVEALARVEPLVVVLEDLHWSDPSTLDLISLLARRREPARFVLVASYRPVEVIVRDHPLRALRQDLVIRSLCVDLPLELLTVDEVRQHLDLSLPGLDSADLAAAVHRRTSGNALFVVALLDHLRERALLVESEGGWRLEASPAEIEAEIPESLREMIEQQVDRVGADDARLLEVASVVGMELSAGSVAVGLDEPVLSVEARLEALARKGRLSRPRGVATTPGGDVTGRFEFVHALYQAVLYERVPPARRARLHARIGGYLEQAGAAPALLAHHFHRAATPDTARKAFLYARRAGDAVAQVAFDEAIGHYGTALAVLELDPGATEAERLAVLLDRAETQQRAGRYAEAQELFGRSIERARALGDPELFARAVLGLGAAHQPAGTVDERLAHLLEEALERLGNRNDAFRAMVLARLAYALYHAPGTERRRAALCEEAVATARHSGDLRALVWTLQYAPWATWAPANLAARRARVDELVELADRQGDRGHQVTAHASRLIDALEAGDIATVDEEIEVFAQRAEESRQPWFLWSVLRFRALRAMLDGRLAEAEKLIEESFRVGQRFENPDVLPLYGAQVAMLRTQQGRAGELEALVVPLAERPPRLPIWRSFLALLRCQAGRLDEARRDVELVAANGFDALPEDNLLLGSLSFLAEACARIGDARRAASLYERFAPYAKQCVVVSFGVACRGAVSRYLGLLAATCRRWREAEQAFEHALEMHERMGARPWLVATQQDYARLLLERYARGPRRERGLALARAAAAAARELGLEVLIPPGSAASC